MTRLPKELWNQLLAARRICALALTKAGSMRTACQTDGRRATGEKRTRLGSTLWRRLAMLWLTLAPP